MRPRLLWLLGLAAGSTVANLYYVQPLVDMIGRDLEVSLAAAGLLVTLTQLGFVVGLLIVVPLGDLVSRRTLAVGLLLAAAAALMAAAAAPTFMLLAVAIALLGITAVVAQVLVPFAAALSAEVDRGRVIGSIMTGVMLGTLLSRTVAGGLASVAGWRLMFGLAALAMIGLAGVLRRELPADARTVSIPYRRLLRSVAELALREPVLQRRALYGAGSFAVFTGFWTALPFLLARPPYGFGEAVIGAVALIGIPGALLAPRAGAWTDRGRGVPLTGLALILMLVGAGLTLTGTRHLAPLLIGGVLISLGSGCIHVANQSLIYRIDPSARSRLATAYMSAVFTGGMAGSAVAGAAFAQGGWTAVCVIMAIPTVVCLVGWCVEARAGGRLMAVLRLACPIARHSPPERRREAAPDV